MTVQIDRQVSTADDAASSESSAASENWTPLVPAVEPLDYTDAVDLGAQIVAGAAKVATTTAAWIEMVGVFDVRGGADRLWMDSTAQWLAFACSMSAGTAREHVRIARALRQMPIIAESFNRGKLTFSKVRECTRLAGMIDEEVLLKGARDWTAAQLERAVRGFRAGRTDRLVAEQQRRVTIRSHTDGTVQITAFLPAEEAAAVIAALDVADTRHRTAQQTARADATLEDALEEVAVDGNSTGADEDVPMYTRADALIDVARGYVETGPADTSGEDRDIVVINVSADDLRRATRQTPLLADSVDVPAGTPTEPDMASTADHPTDDETVDRTRVAASKSTTPTAWIESVGSVSATTAARVACSALIQIVVTDDATGEVLQLGRTQRLASKQQRRAMMARDRHCRFPGCIRAVRLHAHHITPWMLGGLTDVDKMVMLCQHHHVLVHAASITITRHRPGYSFTRIGGELITAQHPSQYSQPAPASEFHRPFREADLLSDLIADARTLEPELPSFDPWSPAPRMSTPNDSEWDLPVAMESVRDLTDFYDFDTNVFPRWAGERMTEGDYWELFEPHATEPRTNPEARY